MEKGLACALRVARQFGAEAVANSRKFSKDDREDIAHYYGVDAWSDIPLEDRKKLLGEFRSGECAERENDGYY